MSYYLYYGNSIDNIRFKLKNDIIEEVEKYYFDLNNESFYDFEKILFQNSFFEPKKHIIIENFYQFINKSKDNFDKIIKLLKVDIDHEVYFYEEDISFDNERIKKVLLYVETVKLNEVDFDYIKNFILTSLEKENIKINEELIEYIYKKTKDNLFLIKNELEKLIINSLDTKVIKKQDIDLLINEQMDENIYDLLQLIKSDEKEKAVVLLNKLLFNNLSPILIIDKLCLTYIDLYKVKKLIEKGKDIDYMSKFLNYSFNKTYYLTKEANNFSFNYLKEKIQILTDYDFLAKTSSFNAKEYLEIFILRG